MPERVEIGRRLLTSEESSLLSCFTHEDFPYPSKNLYRLAQNVAIASGKGLDSRILYKGCGREEIEMILNTARLASLTQTGVTPSASIMIHPERFAFREGLLILELSWVHADQLTRVLEIGWLVDSKGNLGILRSQRHPLGGGRQTVRSLIKSDEKRKGDRFYEKTKKRTGLSPEALGIVAAATVFGKNVPSGRVFFYDSGRHPAISLISVFGGAQEMVNFPGMLGQIGVDGSLFEREKGPFFSVPIEVIKTAFTAKMANQYPRGHKYTEALRGLEQIYGSR